MSFEFSYATSGDGVVPAKNFPLATAYAATAKKGDVVRLNASQELEKAGASNSEVLGVLESVVFEGQGVTPKLGQVKYSQDAVFRTEYSGTVAPTVGVSYALLNNTTQEIDQANVGTGKIYKVVEVISATPTSKIVEVQITGGTFK